MNKQRVFVFPCGTEIGLEIQRALWCAKEVELWGGSSTADHGRFVYRNYLGNIPYVTDPGFLAHINRLVTENNFDYIIPAHDDVVLLLAQAAAVGGLACNVLTSPLETCRITRSKKLTSEFFRTMLRVPRLYAELDTIDSWPIFLKPDIGQGAKGTATVHSLAEARRHLEKRPDLLAYEYLPGAEYTIDCFTDRHGDLLFAGGRERCRILNGISVHTKPVALPEFFALAQIINAALTFRGMWFFQVKRSADGELSLMEISPRLAGTMGMYRNLGVNFPLLSLYAACGHDVRPLCNNYATEMDRALVSRFHNHIDYKSVYIDLDDCLLIDGKINTQAMAYLHQCLNNGIAIHLLTRHNGNLSATLQRLRLSGFFDTVVHLQQQEKKSGYIAERNAIFIDDSFAERLDVQQSLGIPVFAPDAIESLLEQ